MASPLPAHAGGRCSGLIHAPMPMWSCVLDITSCPERLVTCVMQRAQRPASSAHHRCDVGRRVAALAALLVAELLRVAV
eukprot:4138051-Prymnesium_polylepis.1